MHKADSSTVRQDLLACLQAALQAVNGRSCVEAYLSRTDHRLYGEPALVAIGKAATAMTEGALAALGERIRYGLVITKSGYGAGQFLGRDDIECLESGHPVPDSRSLAAGERLLEFVQGLPAAMPVVFLISGGASALVEVLPAPLGLADLQAINTAMLAAGMPIGAINRVRQAVSRIKGGGLLNYLGERQVLNLLISDVPGNDPATIGSGLLVRVPPTELPPGLPDTVTTLLAGLTHSAPSFTRQAGVHTAIVADNNRAVEAAARLAGAKGYPVTCYPELLTADVNAVAEQVITHLRHAGRGMHIWGGEPTVQLPPRPGRGGRNQHLALLLASRITGWDNVHILAAATDGSDGPTADAGGLVDSQTIARGEEAGLDAPACLQQANAGEFLEAGGDLISTGPTGTNVMDLLVACKT